MKDERIKRVVKYAIIAVLTVCIGTGGYYAYNKFFLKANVKTASNEATARVERGNLSVTITGTGAVSPISKYDIVPLVKGTILQAPFEEGMDVKAGDLLYKIDDSDLSYNIQKSQIGLEKLNVTNQSNVDSIKNLVVYAPFDGKITNFSLKPGEQVSGNGKIADLIDDKTLSIFVPYEHLMESKMSVGQKVKIQIDSDSALHEGMIKYINDTPKASENGVMLSQMEIGFDNPVTLVEDTILDVIPEGKAASDSIPGKVSYSQKQSVVALTSGTVKTVFIKNDNYVKKGDKILELENDTLAQNSQQYQLNLKDSQLSLDAQVKQLNDYNILSPISGKVIKKSYKAGDTVNAGTSSTVLMTVADLSKMVFTISVDELDIAKVKVGQKVDVTADALPGVKFEGEVTNVALDGTTSNGVTTYPVKVTISQPGDLKPGMNVSAKIQIEDKSNVLYLPVDAVTKVGGKSYVTVKADSTTNNRRNKSGSNQGNAAGQQPPDNGIASKAGPQNAQSNNQQGATQPQIAGNTAANPGNDNSNMKDRLRKEVVTGISTDDYIEIVSGLSEGEIVYLASTSTKTTNANNNMMGGGMGGPPMGGPPPGGN